MELPEPPRIRRLGKASRQRSIMRHLMSTLSQQTPPLHLKNQSHSLRAYCIALRFWYGSG